MTSNELSQDSAQDEFLPEASADDEPLITDALVDLMEEVQPPMTGALSGLARELRFTVDDEDDDDSETEAGASSEENKVVSAPEIRLARPRFGNLVKASPPKKEKEEGFITDALDELIEEVQPPMAGALSGLARELRFTVDDEDDETEIEDIEYVSDDELDASFVDEEDFISVDDDEVSDEGTGKGIVEAAIIMASASGTDTSTEQPQSPAEKPEPEIAAEADKPAASESMASEQAETAQTESAETSVTPEPEPAAAEVAVAEPPTETSAVPVTGTSSSPFITTEAAAAETGEPVEIKYQYRVSAVLSPEIEVMLNKVRQVANLPAAEPGFFTFQSGFQVEDIQVVITAVRDWANDNLPLSLELTRVDAVTIGARRYLAGWLLEPADEFERLQDTLRQSLALHIDWRADAELPSGARLVAGDFVPPKDFPLLVREMQREFDVIEWRLDSVEVLRAPQFDTRWEVVEKITVEDK